MRTTNGEDKIEEDAQGQVFESPPTIYKALCEDINEYFKSTGELHWYEHSDTGRKPC